MENKRSGDYPAKEAYLENHAENYDANRTRTHAGRLEWNREIRVVKALLTAWVSPTSSVLDAPTGTGRFLPIISQRCSHVVGVDISNDMLREARVRMGDVDIELLCADCESLPFEDHKYDYVFSLRFLGHLPSKARIAVLKEFRRVARRGLIVGFPVLNPLTHVKFLIGNVLYRWQKGKKRPWWPSTPAGMAAELEEAGLMILDQKHLRWPFSQIVFLLLATKD